MGIIVGKYNFQVKPPPPKNHLKLFGRLYLLSQFKTVVLHLLGLLIRFIFFLDKMCEIVG